MKTHGRFHLSCSVSTYAWLRDGTHLPTCVCGDGMVLTYLRVARRWQWDGEQVRSRMCGDGVAMGWGWEFITITSPSCHPHINASSPSHQLITLTSTPHHPPITASTCIPFSSRLHRPHIALASPLHHYRITIASLSHHQRVTSASPSHRSTADLT